jgi:PGF-pre-PGF domain-containing protein
VGSIDVDGKASELNLSLGDTHIAGLNITNASNGAIIEGGYVLINSSETLLVDIKLLMNSSSTSSVNVTIDDINASEASWQNLNFTVTSNAEIDELNIRRNFSAAVLRFVRFNGSTMSDFIPNTNAYFGRVEVGYNLSEARIINGSVFVAMWFTNVSDYSSRTLIDPCTTATGGATTPYTPTKTTPCFNVTNNISSTIFVPSFSAVVVVNDTMAPTVTVNHPQKNEGDSAFILNVTVSQDTSSCQWMINTSAYYDGTDSVRTSWVDMTTPSLLSGTSLYTCQSLLPIGLANFSSSKLGMYNITLNITDNAGNQNITAYIFNVTDSVMPTYTNLTNDSISSSGATIGIESNEYVNASVRYTVGMSPTSSIVTSQSSPFTTKKPIITLSLAPSSYINYSVKVCDVAGICNTTGVYNFTTAGEEDSSGDDTTTTGTGGGVTVAKANNVAAKTSHLWSSLAAGESISMKISNNKIAFKEVKVTTANALTSMKLEVASLKEMPSSLTEASDKVYQYLQVTKTNLADSDVDTATIKFEVTKVWLAESGVAEDDVVLLRYVDGKWNVLTTDKLESGDLTATYIANTPGFSYFAIGSKKGAKTEAPADTPTTDEPTDIPPGESGEGVTEPVKPISTAIWVIIAIVAIIIIAVIIYSAQTKKKH